MNQAALPQSLPRAGSTPRPVRQFVLKIHGRCNLACDYCYVYAMGDESWKHRPALMSDVLVGTIARRIGDHVAAHRLPAVEIVLHGGEPLLAGTDRITRIVRRVRNAAAPAQVDVTMQTNGTLLSSRTLPVLRDLGVGIGVSLDGGRDAHDRHRRTRGHRGSYASTAKGLALLAEPENRSLFRGLLCTIDLANDPIETYEHLLSFGPPAIDLLLPHGNWESLPPGHDPGSTPYARWLTAVFDRWYGAPVRPTRIRLFEAVMNLLAGLPSTVEGLGPRPADMIVVETDGTIAHTDLLTGRWNDPADRERSIYHDAFDTATARHEIPSPCAACDLRTICGGGLRAHRHATGPDPFDHRSVYCEELYTLITHIHRRILADVATLSARP